MDKEISSQKELYNKLLPALRCKKHELERSNIKIIKEIDIWNYNKEKIWCKKIGLTLSSMVDDILNTPNENYEKYIINIINKER